MFQVPEVFAQCSQTVTRKQLDWHQKAIFGKISKSKWVRYSINLYGVLGSTNSSKKDTSPVHTRIFVFSSIPLPKSIYDS